MSGRDLDQLREELMRATGDLWPTFEATQTAELVDMWSFINLKTWGWMGDPNPVRPNRELVYLVDTTDPNLVRTGDHFEVSGSGSVRTIWLTMEYAEPSQDQGGISLVEVQGEPNWWRVTSLSRDVEHDFGTTEP